MDEIQAIEQRIARELHRRAGHSEPVDDAAVFNAITATRPSRWRLPSVFTTAGLVTAAAIMALFGSVLLAGVLLYPGEESPPRAGVSASPTPTEVDESTSPDDTVGLVRPAGQMGEARSGHTATLLPDGRVLIVGGGDPVHNLESPDAGPRLASAELWNPDKGTFTDTDSLTEARWGHSATLMPDGRVTIVGGIGDDAVLTSVEVWDPATETFTRAGSLNEKREFHTATLLRDGRILIVGDVAGAGGGIAEVWDPATGTATEVGRLPGLRWFHAATILADGRALVVGSGIAETWDPATGVWEPTGSSTQWFGHTATLLPDDRVLVAGGNRGPGLPQAEIWDPTSGVFEPIGLPAPEWWSEQTATLLPDGRVLLLGGRTDGWTGTTALVWDLSELTSSPAGAFEPLVYHTSTLLPDGRTLILGGAPRSTGSAQDSALLWDVVDRSEPATAASSATNTPGSSEGSDRVSRGPTEVHVELRCYRAPAGLTATEAMVADGQTQRGPDGRTQIRDGIVQGRIVKLAGDERLDGGYGFFLNRDTWTDPETGASRTADTIEMDIQANSGVWNGVAHRVVLADGSTPQTLQFVLEGGFSRNRGYLAVVNVTELEDSCGWTVDGLVVEGDLPPEGLSWARESLP